MKKWLILLWLMCPVGLIYFHFDQGPYYQFQKEMDILVQKAQRNEKENHWKDATKSYEDAINLLKLYQEEQARQKELRQISNKVEVYSDNSSTLSDLERLDIRLKVAYAKTLTNTANLSTALGIIENQLYRLDSLGVNDELAREVRNDLAICQYYIAWHMRIEGLVREVWLPEIEASRQNFKYLANEALKNNEKEKAVDFMKNLESVIRLKNMSLPALRLLELPEKGAGKGESQAGLKRKNKKRKEKKQRKKGKKGKKEGKPEGKKKENSRKANYKKFKLQPGS